MGQVSVAYSYSEFDESEDEKIELNKILENAYKNNLRFISDTDSRPKGSSHPLAHLWDNGEDAIIELKKYESKRYSFTKHFIRSFKKRRTVFKLQDVIVPIYLLHRYQSEAVVKLIGGVDYDYV